MIDIKGTKIDTLLLSQKNVEIFQGDQSKSVKSFIPSNIL